MDRLDGEGKCVMRGSCGKKGFFGKPLPCPYDGPPQEVRVVKSFEIVLLTGFPPSWTTTSYFNEFVAQILHMVQFAARQTNWKL
jgi:hypothetical protein